MNAVYVDPKIRRARVQGGATWADFDREAQAYGLATPGGLVSTTGVGGLTLAGGVGWLWGKYGLSLDNLASVEIVTADGVLRSASEMLAGVWAGPADEGAGAVQCLRELAKPLLDFSGQMPYREVQRLYDGLFPNGVHRAYFKSLYLYGLDNAVIDEIAPRAAARPTDRTLCSVWYLGGTVGRVPRYATAFGDRGMRWMLSIDAIWEHAADDEKNPTWARAFWPDLKRHSSGRAQRPRGRPAPKSRVRWVSNEPASPKAAPRPTSRTPAHLLRFTTTPAAYRSRDVPGSLEAVRARPKGVWARPRLTERIRGSLLRSHEFSGFGCWPRVKFCRLYLAHQPFTLVTAS
jgi:hypothetical protein